MKASLGLGLVIVAGGLAACGSSTTDAASTGDGSGGGASTGGSETATTGSSGGSGTAGTTSPGDPSVGGRVSSSGGPEGGVVILWPRLVPAESADALREPATQVQARLRAIVERALPGRQIEVRPEPERACPQAGCTAVAISAVLFRRDNGCVAAATGSRPGRSPTRIVAWAGEMTLRQSEVGFREPPESQIRATDMVPCDRLLDELSQGDTNVEGLVRELGQ
ncbi:MAG: hypothetical protein IT379_19290 [Deltaproteobacteria bacterium]|nr:hypothetical protein [Deltaproteobacteria bacterium]